MIRGPLQPEHLRAAAVRLRVTQPRPAARLAILATLLEDHPELAEWSYRSRLCPWSGRATIWLDAIGWAVLLSLLPACAVDATWSGPTWRRLVIHDALVVIAPRANGQVGDA